MKTPNEYKGCGSWRVVSREEFNQLEQQEATKDPAQAKDVSRSEPSSPKALRNPSLQELIESRKNKNSRELEKNCFTK